MGVSAQALSSTLVSSLGGPGAASIGLQSAVPITGPAAASAAGLPASIASLGTVIQTPGVVGSGAAAGAAGASGGLSGGSIAGIVVGSVAGAILFAGVATLVVAVAVLSSSDEGDDEGPSRADDSDKRKSVRKTLRGFFGGVDVMNDPKGHQSISARSPAM